MIPDHDACRALWEKAGLEEDVIQHVQTVQRLATRMANESQDANVRIVEAAALLHDIGRAFTHTTDHVPQGVAFLQDEGIHEAVVSCVACHMGAGIPQETADAWGWPPDRRYMPETIEEKIVCHADTLTFGTRHGTLEDAVTKFQDRDLEHVARRVQALHEDLEARLRVDLSRLVQQLGET